MSYAMVETVSSRGPTPNLRDADLESQILKKYLHGDHLDPKDNRGIINELKSIGLLRCGFDLDEDMETIRTTERGRDLLRCRGIRFD